MFKQIESNKVYIQIIEQIKDSIRNGQLKKGDRLPSERKMSEQLGVSRATVREAIRSLEIMGLVKCIQGEGNFITDNLENSLIEPISMMFILNQGKINEIGELRRALELEAVEIASKKISNSSINILRELCETIENGNNEAIRAEADKQFHYEIAKASENILIINILNAASFLVENFIKDIRVKILAGEENTDIINSQHRCILDALESRDTEKAVYSMQKHMELINRFINELKI